MGAAKRHPFIWHLLLKIILPLIGCVAANDYKKVLHAVKTCVRRSIVNLINQWPLLHSENCRSKQVA
jgi:hypothetical protein